MVHSIFRLTVCAAIVLTACGRVSRPSIVFILADTLRADYLTSYGFHGDISPNLTRLASQAIQFENCFAQAPWTKPSVATLFTSLQPSAHGVTDYHGPSWDEGERLPSTTVLPDRALTLAEAFQESGYLTAAFVANPWLRERFGFGQGFDIYDDRGASNTMTGDLILARARAWLERIGERRFFLYLHLMDVHGPYASTAEDYRELRTSPSLGEPRRLTRAERAAVPPYLLRTGWSDSSDAIQLTAWRARYAGGVRGLDRRLGRFFDWLQSERILDRSVLIVTSDHGEELAEHGGWDHGWNLFDHQLRVPLLVRRPGGRRGGRRVGEVVSLIDLMPTLLRAAGVEIPAGLQGRDLSPLLSADGGMAERVSFATAVKNSRGLFAVRTGRHKLLFDLTSGWRNLFDLHSDPGERTDVAQHEPELLEALQRALLAHLEELERRGSLDPETTPIPPELRAGLEALGYLQ